MDRDGDQQRGDCPRDGEDTRGGDAIHHQADKRAPPEQAHGWMPDEQAKVGQLGAGRGIDDHVSDCAGHPDSGGQRLVQQDQQREGVECPVPHLPARSRVGAIETPRPQARTLSTWCCVSPGRPGSPGRVGSPDRVGTVPATGRTGPAASACLRLRCCGGEAGSGSPPLWMLAPAAVSVRWKGEPG
jgi:hypothetical protein